LVHITVQKVKVNDRITNIAFFKDVTFGILYEQFKASEKLQNIINETINDKIGLPLDSLVSTCN
jgi:hypothetical protein